MPHDVTAVCFHWITLSTVKRQLDMPSESANGYIVNLNTDSIIEYSFTFTVQQIHRLLPAATGGEKIGINHTH